MNERTLIPGKVVLVLIILGTITLVLWIIWYDQWNTKYGDFEKIKTDSEFKSSIQLLRTYKGYSYVRLNNDKRQYVINQIHNYRYQPYRLTEIVSSGDSLVKKASSDTLFLFKKGKSYYFLLSR